MDAQRAGGWQGQGRALLEMEGISVEFPGVRALQGASLRVEAGTIHALVGANGAGKSTLMKVLGGAQAADAGRIRLDGVEARIRSPRDAQALGIQVVHQEVDTALVPTLSVGENVLLDVLARGGPGGALVRWGRLHARAAAALGRLGVSLDTRRRVESLGLAQKQLVLLARALAAECRLLVLDEPTAPLSAIEAEELFRVLRELATRGTAVIFISHRLGELVHLCQSVTVLRDGRVVGSHALSGLTADDLARLMLGRSPVSAGPRAVAAPGAALLSVERLSDGRRLRDVSLTLRAGEVVGLAGLVGAGKSELCRALFGAASICAGAARLRGEPYRPRHPAEAVRRGVALVPEERRAEGVLVQESVAVNLTAAALGACTGPLGLLRPGAERRAARDLVARLGIRTPDERRRVALLSGGNQQKVVLGKWLLADADVYLLDEPTKGVDVGARAELLALVAGLAAAGKAVLYASSEPEELLQVAHRICVLREGRITAELPAADTTAAEVLLHAAGGAWA